MAITRQYGTKANGTFTFSPAFITVNVSLLSVSGEFHFPLAVNIKDADGLVLANQPIEFKVKNAPAWLVVSEQPVNFTDKSGSVSFVIRGTLKNPAPGQYSAVSFIVSGKNIPELKGSGLVSFIGMLPKE